MKKNDINLFFGTLVISLMGNVCADYALMWHGLTLMINKSSKIASLSLSNFYIGQAFGVILISPLLAVVFDRFSKLFSSIALDLIYAFILLFMVLLYKSHLFSMMTAALSILHKSSVGFAAVQRMGQISGLTKLTVKYISALNIPFLIGSVISGIIYKNFGFTSCILIGIITFIPMPYVYYRIFGHDKKVDQVKKSNFIGDLKEGMKALYSDKLISITAISVSIINISSSVLPAIVGYVFLKAYPDRTDYASMAISISIFGGILFTKHMGKISRDLPMNSIVPFSILPEAIILVVSLIYPNPFLMALMFLFSCIGSNMRNVSSGTLRVTRIPKHLIGRVNTIYSSLLYIGQSIGGFFLVKTVQQDLNMAMISILVCLLVGSIFSLFVLPKEKISSIRNL
jgi:hypothetical protein